jgi:DNA-binding SARP family transcriptional activator
VTLRAKVLPPPLASACLPREHLRARLDGASGRRLTTVIAGAGFGKSTLVAAWGQEREMAWYTLGAEDAGLSVLSRGVVEALRRQVPDLPLDVAGGPNGGDGPAADADECGRADAFAAALSEALQERMRGPLTIVFDDLHEVGLAAGSLRAIEGLCRQAPPGVHLVLVSRTDMPFSIDRLRGQGQALELGGSDLAFDREEVGALLEQALGPGGADVAGLLHQATGGWPVAVRLAAEAMRGLAGPERAVAVERLRRPGGVLFAYLAHEVFEREPPEVRELVRLVAPLERFHAGLCAELGMPDAAELLGSLARRGLFVESGPDPGWFALGALARDFALEAFPLRGEQLSALHRRAAAWFSAHEQPELALRSLTAGADHDGIAALLLEHGRALVHDGAGDAVARAAAGLPPEMRDGHIELLLARAHKRRGDLDAALACLHRAAAGDGPLPPEIAWRTGLIHHLRGELDEALRFYERGRAGGPPTPDEAMLHAWHASALWLRGTATRCGPLARRAFAVASATGDDRALAAAHTILAMLAALEGDRAVNAVHYEQALRHAERSGDVLQVIRIRTNRGSRHLEEGEYEAAIGELDLAIRLADVAGYASFRALALTNRGEARLRLGSLEEAIADLEAAKTLSQRLGSGDLAYPLGILGDVYRERGDVSLARAAYEEAARRSEAMGDVQALVPALAGLARVIALDEPDRARRLVDRAIAHGPGMGQVDALLAGGHVALAQGEREQGGRLAADAAAAARRRRNRAGLAEALELGALATQDHALARTRLEEAASIWNDLRNPLGEARVWLALARVAVGQERRELATRAEARLRELGARGHAAAAHAVLDPAAAPAVAIQSLGRFRVLRDGEPVALSEWRSRKARDLLKMLVARRGRPVPRDVLMEVLWPGEPADKLANRLSVALSTVRGVLDPDRRFAADHFVTASSASVALVLDHVAVDVEAFLKDAAAGLRMREEARAAEARHRLAAAEAAYLGDFLEEDVYEDWAIMLREEAREAYVGVARTLAADARTAGEHDRAVRFLLRVLEHDGYDEQAHLALVAALVDAGRHGEARRAFRAYRARMDQIGVEAAPFPHAVPPAAAGVSAG